VCKPPSLLLNWEIRWHCRHQVYEDSPPQDAAHAKFEAAESRREEDAHGEAPCDIEVMMLCSPARSLRMLRDILSLAAAASSRGSLPARRATVRIAAARAYLRRPYGFRYRGKSSIHRSSQPPYVAFRLMRQPAAPQLIFTMQTARRAKRSC